MKSRQATEVQIAFERLQYLKAKMDLMNSTMNNLDGKIKADIFKSLGYRFEKETKTNGKQVTVAYYDGYKKSLNDIYKDEYISLCEKLESFYKAVSEINDERLKYVCELRYIEGIAWKEIAEKVQLGETTIYAFRSTLVEYLKKKDCTWCLKNT